MAQSNIDAARRVVKDAFNSIPAQNYTSMLFEFFSQQNACIEDMKKYYPFKLSPDDRKRETIEDLLVDINALESDQKVALAREEETVREALLQKRTELNALYRKGKDLAEKGVTIEHLKTIAGEVLNGGGPDWGC